MMKKYLILLSLIFFSSGIVFAQTELDVNTEPEEGLEVLSVEDEEAESVEFEEEIIIPYVFAEEFVEHGNVSAFNAEGSKLVSPSSGTPVYWWDYGDGTPLQYGREVAHQYQKTGKYTVKLTIKQGKEKASSEKDIFVYNQKGILISDNIEEISEVVYQAAEKGIWLKEITYDKDESGFSAEDEFVRKIQENISFAKESDLIIFHTKSVIGLQSFAQLWQKLSRENKFDLKDKLWVKLVEGSLDQVAKLAQPLFKILQPRFILLTRLEALNPIFEQRKLDSSENLRIIDNLKSRAIEYRIIDERSRTSPFLIFSQLVTYFVSHGISQNVVYLLLVVPFLTFVTSFVRQVIGMSTYGVYAPLVLSLSFFVLGMQFGLVVFFVTLCVSYLIRVLFEKVDLLYIPRLSLLLSSLALSFFLVLGLAIYFQTSLNLSLAIFPMLVMSTVSEKFLSAQSEGGIRSAIVVAGETVVVSLMGFFLFDMPFFKEAILALPEYIILPVLGNIWLGRFTGLRLTEYFKFRSLWREETQEE